jgi:hypothetical protein
MGSMRERALYWCAGIVTRTVAVSVTLQKSHREHK